MRVITIMVDYGGAWAWEREATGGGIGSNIASHDFWGGHEDIPPDLIQKFAEWQLAFDQISPGEFDKRSCQFNWAQFHRRGLQLAQELRQYLPQDVRLFYEKPYEDPEYYALLWECPDWLVEVHSNGETRPILSPEEMLSIRLLESDDSPRTVAEIRRRVIVHLHPDWGWCWLGREKQNGLGVLIGFNDLWKGPVYLPEGILRIAQNWFDEYEKAYLNDYFDWEESHKKGLEITKKIRKVLPGSCPLYYIRAGEDPCFNPGHTYSDCPESLLKYNSDGSVVSLDTFNNV